VESIDKQKLNTLKVGEWHVDVELGRVRSGEDEATLQPQVMQLLVYMARNAGEVISVDRMIEEVWSGKPMTGGSVYNALNALRKAFGDNKEAPRYIETIPRRGYRLIAEVHWVPPQSSLPAQGKPGKRHPSSALSRAVKRPAVLVILGLVATLILWYSRSPAPGPDMLTTATIPPEKSIAVLPFVDMSPEGNQGWFADGLAEEILNTLVRTPDLMVSSRTSSFKFRNSELDLPGIARELGVAHVLEGSVRRADNQIRVTAQLIRAADGFHIWSENFDHEADDLIRVQENLALNIAKALRTTIDPGELEKMLKAGTRSVQAYEHYLNGLALNARVSESSDFSLIIGALEHFDNAWKTDPEFAEAHFLAAQIWKVQLRPNLRGYGVIDIESGVAYANYRERMRVAIGKASNDSQRVLYEADLALNELRVTDAVQLSLNALELTPNSIEATYTLARAARFSLDQKSQMLALENFLKMGNVESIVGFLNFARWVLPSEQYTATVFEQAARFPNSKRAIYQAHRALLWAGEFEEAKKLYSRLSHEQGEYRWLVDVRQACSEGDVVTANQVLRVARQHGTDEGILWYILTVLGRNEEAVNVMRPVDSAEVPIVLGGYLAYDQFDPRPFPALMAVLEREGIDWPPSRKIPFACSLTVEN
jgi:TolB-like protein/DNA-binding winged helix-turn-helix (wHTH) protein